MVPDFRLDLLPQFDPLLQSILLSLAVLWLPVIPSRHSVQDFLPVLLDLADQMDLVALGHLSGQPALSLLSHLVLRPLRRCLHSRDFPSDLENRLIQKVPMVLKGREFRWHLGFLSAQADPMHL